MSRFLSLVENNIPSQEEGSMSMLVDKLVELLDTIGSVTVTSTAPSKELIVEVDEYTITLVVKDIHPSNKEEEEENSLKSKYNLDQNVEGLAAQAKTGISGAIAGAFGTVAQQAKQAVKKREALVKQAVPLYDKVTDALGRAIDTARITVRNQSIT